MNKAFIKYNKIVCVSGQFQGSITIVKEDIVATLTQKHEKNQA